MDIKPYCHSNVTIEILEQSIKTFNSWLFSSINCLMGKIIFKRHVWRDLWVTDNRFPNLHTHSLHLIQTVTETFTMWCIFSQMREPFTHSLQNLSQTRLVQLKSPPLTRSASLMTWSFQTATVMPGSPSPSGGRGGNHGPITPSDVPVREVSAPSAGSYQWSAWLFVVMWLLTWILFSSLLTVWEILFKSGFLTPLSLRLIRNRTRSHITWLG